jgi:Domain of Unknown Function with PDB structure (DUF3857)
MRKKTIRILVLIFVIALNVNSMYGQNYKDHKWFKARAHTVIPDSLMSEDAVMIYNNQYIYNDIVDISSSKFSSKRTVMQKIKILTKKGLEDYSKVFVNIYPKEHIKVVDARTIKPNGKTINLKSKDIKQLTFKSRFYQDSRFQQLRFSIPGVEVGDEVEIIYTVKSGTLNQGGDIIMNSYLPCISASVTYGSSKAFVHEFKMYNGMSKFVNQSTQTNTTLVWRMSNLKSIGNEYRAIYTNHIPYIRYVLRRYSDGYNSIDISTNNWDNLYKKYKTYYNDPTFINGTSFIKGFIQKFKTQNPTANNTQIFMEIHQYIYDNIDVQILENGKDQRLLRYYVENKVINNYNLYMLYEQLFKMLEIKHYICFGRNKYAGILERSFVAPHVIQHDFYSFNDGDQLHFVYPSLSYKKYLLDELPLSIRGTKIMMISDGKKGSIFTDSREVKIPMSSPEKNYTLKKIDMKINSPSDSIFNSTSSTVLSGIYSTIYRQSHLKKIEENDFEFYSSFISENEIKIDSLYMSNIKVNSPYNYTLNSTQQFPLQFSKIDDNLYNLNMSQLFSISNLYASDKKRHLNYYTRYMYSDNTIVKFNFDQNIKIENIENLNNLSMENDFGSLKINIEQVNEKSLIINVSYKIKKEILNSGDYQWLRDLNIALKDLLDNQITLTFE